MGWLPGASDSAAPGNRNDVVAGNGTDKGFIADVPDGSGGASLAPVLHQQGELAFVGHTDFVVLHVAEGSHGLPDHVGDHHLLGFGRLRLLGLRLFRGRLATLALAGPAHG